MIYDCCQHCEHGINDPPHEEPCIEGCGDPPEYDPDGAEAQRIAEEFADGAAELARAEAEEARGG